MHDSRQCGNFDNRLQPSAIRFQIPDTSSIAAEWSLDKNVLSMHAKLDELCRGGSGDDPATQVTCDARLNFEQTLAQLGYCYGIGDRAHAAWHKCQR